ncbi:MAG: type 1 glutamine amidotransferase [Planctomycetota bacterium]
MFEKLRFLLFQVRNADDPMRRQELECFARALQCDCTQIQVCDLLREVPTRAALDQVDMVLLGGSGDHSVAKGGHWLPAALEAMRELHDWSKPTFASCWGFQAMAAALGGEVLTDPKRAELGTTTLHLTEAGRNDPVFSTLPRTFRAQSGHQDTVDRLPVGAELLASSDRVANQAFRIPGKPIYCTQFHPELTREALLERIRVYPEYVEKIAGIPYARFAAGCAPAPESETLIRRATELYFS